MLSFVRYIRLCCVAGSCAVAFLTVWDRCGDSEPRYGPKAIWQARQRGLPNAARFKRHCIIASTGHLCRAHIRSDDTSGITDAQLNAVLEALAPKSVRGKYKMGTFLNITCLKARKGENSTLDSGG